MWGGGSVSGEQEPLLRPESMASEESLPGEPVGESLWGGETSAHGLGVLMEICMVLENRLSG